MTNWPIRREWGEEVIADGGKLAIESGGEMDIEDGGKLAIESGGEMDIEDGGKLAIESGGEMDIEAGGVFKIAGVPVTASASDLNALPPDGVQGLAANYVLARGQHTTIAASDTVVTGLATVVVVVAQLDDDPVDGCMHVTSSIGDQAGAPAAGSILIKTWKSEDADATLVAATTFGKKVNWIAIGTQ